MTGLIPFNRKNANAARTGTDFENFYNLIDDFFNDGVLPGRNLLRDSFKIDIAEKDNEYVVEAELPGIKKSEIDLSVEDETLRISVNRSEEANKDGHNYVHRERRATSMSRGIRLANAKLDKITAKLDDGVLTVTITKDVKSSGSRKIDIK